MNRPRNFLPGERFADPLDAVRAVAAGQWVWNGSAVPAAGRWMGWGRPMHPSWALSLQTRLLLGWARSGAIRQALVAPAYRLPHPLSFQQPPRSEEG